MRRESRRQDAEIPTAIRPRAHGRTHTRTRSHTDMLAYRNCTSTTPCRTGWVGGTLVYSFLAGPGRRPWAQKPGEKKKVTQRRNIRRTRTREETPRPVTQRRNTTTSHSEKKHTKKKKQRTFCHRYVSAHSDATMFLENYTAIIRFGNTFGHTSLFL